MNQNYLHNTQVHNEPERKLIFRRFIEERWQEQQQ